MKQTQEAACWAEEAISRLRALADPEAARQVRTYFKKYDEVDFFGIKTPRLKDVEKDIYRSVRPHWTIQDVTAFCDATIRNRYLEVKGVGILLLSRYQKQYRPDLLARIHGWLDEGHCRNWATTDTLSGKVLTPLLLRYPRLIGKTSRWTRSPDLWVRRAAAVSLVLPARRGEYLEDAYEVAQALFADPEDLMHKAVGWLLRECGKTDSARLESFLLEHGPRIPEPPCAMRSSAFPRAGETASSKRPEPQALSKTSRSDL